MKKKTVWVILAAALLVIAGSILFFTRQDAGRIDLVQEDGHFAVAFDTKHLKQEQPMALSAGDTLRVSWKIDAGKADVVIGIQGEAPIYQANGRGAGDAADFDLTIPAAGRYLISVSAQNARGTMDFAKQAEGDSSH